MPGLVQRALSRARAGLKAFAMVWGRSSSSGWTWTQGWGRYNYEADVGEGRSNSMVLACLKWKARTFPEAPLTVTQDTGDGNYEPILRHPMQELIRRPNPYYSGMILWAATIADLDWTGNAYWVKERSGAGQPVRLYYVPSALITPKRADGSRNLVDAYEYKPGGSTGPIMLQPTDVVHYRDGIDPHNTMLGQSQLAALAREIFTDEEASRYTAAILKNMGVPGVAISAAGDTDIDPETTEVMKAEFLAKFGGDKRGEPMVLSSPIKIDVLSFSPEQMNLRDLRRIPEERVTAVLGVAAIVVGLGAGLDRSTFANFSEAREAAVEQNLVPTWRLLAEDLRNQLLPDFEADISSLEVTFDLSKVRVLQEDANALSDRINRQLLSGRITLNEARAADGQPQQPAGDIYYLPANVRPVRAEDFVALVSAPPGTGIPVEEPSQNGRAPALTEA